MSTWAVSHWVQDGIERFLESHVKKLKCTEFGRCIGTYGEAKEGVYEVYWFSTDGEKYISGEVAFTAYEALTLFLEHGENECPSRK